MDVLASLAAGQASFGVVSNASLVDGFLAELLPEDEAPDLSDVTVYEAKPQMEALAERRASRGFARVARRSNSYVLVHDYATNDLWVGRDNGARQLFRLRHGKPTMIRKIDLEGGVGEAFGREPLPELKTTYFSGAGMRDSVRFVGVIQTPDKHLILEGSKVLLPKVGHMPNIVLDVQRPWHRNVPVFGYATLAKLLGAEFYATPQDAKADFKKILYDLDNQFNDKGLWSSELYAVAKGTNNPKHTSNQGVTLVWKGITLSGNQIIRFYSEESGEWKLANQQTSPMRENETIVVMEENNLTPSMVLVPVIEGWSPSKLRPLRRDVMSLLAENRPS